MTKYTGFNIEATFGATGFGCLNSADVNLSADIYTAACAGETYKSRVAGATEGSFTINYTFDDSGFTELSAITPATTGTFTLSTNGTEGPTYSCAAVVESNNQSFPVEGIVSGVAVIGVNGLLTIA